MHPTPVALQVLALRPNVSLHALLVAPRALVPVAGLRQLASAWFGGDASRALLERLQALTDNPTATVEGGGGGNAAEPAGALEELLPLLIEAHCRPLSLCTQAAIVYFPRLQPCVPSAVAACHPACNPMCPRHGRSSTRRTGSGSARPSPPRSPPPACSRGTSSRRSCARSRGRLLLLPTPPLMTSASESCTRQPLTARAACQQAQSTLARSYE